MKKVSFLLNFILMVGFCFAQPLTEETVNKYVSAHKDMAVREMEQYRIPASITLAQAVYSSKAGTNRQAVEANNHFGIMCHTDEWTGEKFYETENHASEYCFRKYDAVEESYRDHSLFLAKRPRYASLFELPITDYEAWARGLKELGYSGNVRYADTLIAIIRKYELYQYDKASSEKNGVTATKKTEEVSLMRKIDLEKAVEKENVVSSKETGTSADAVTVGSVNYFILDPANVSYKQAYYPYTKRPVYENNKTKFILAKSGDTYRSLAQSLQLTEKNLRLYNDASDDVEPLENEVVYVELKSTKSPVDYHILTAKDTYRYIAQKYGVQLKIILKRNSGSIKNYQLGDQICIGCK